MSNVENTISRVQAHIDNGYTEEEIVFGYNDRLTIDSIARTELGVELTDKEHEAVVAHFTFND